MGSLKSCLKKIGLEAHEQAIINGSVATYRDEGYEAQQAAVEAVKDYIGQLEDERKSIDSQISKQRFAATHGEGAVGPEDKRLDDKILAGLKRSGYIIGRNTLLENNLAGEAKDDIEAAIARLLASGQITTRDTGKGVTVYEVPQDMTPRGPRAAGATAQLGNWVTDKIAKKEPFTWQELFKAADARFGGTQAEGKYTVKDAYDAMELGVNRAIMDSVYADPTIDAAGAKVQIKYLQNMIDNLPTQTKRTQEQQEFQQFSTPPPLAYVVNWALNLLPTDTFLEPSGGIGGIAVFAFNAGVGTVYANELSPRRAEILKTLPFKQVFTENAEQLNNILPAEVRPTVIGMNPPFSATGGRLKNNQTKFGAQHIEQRSCDGKLHYSGPGHQQQFRQISRKTSGQCPP